MDEVDKALEFNRLFTAARENAEAIAAFSHRLNERFGYRILLPRHGKPTHIRGFHNGPYWGALQKDPRVGPKPELPRVIHEEYKALSAQGVRIRKAILAIWPECDLQFLYPLNVLGRR